jgi:hypothetical protein
MIDYTIRPSKWEKTKRCEKKYRLDIYILLHSGGLLQNCAELVNQSIDVYIKLHYSMVWVWDFVRRLEALEAYGGQQWRKAVESCGMLQPEIHPQLSR